MEEGEKRASTGPVECKPVNTDSMVTVPLSDRESGFSEAPDTPKILNGKSKPAENESAEDPVETEKIEEMNLEPLEKTVTSDAEPRKSRPDLRASISPLPSSTYVPPESQSPAAAQTPSSPESSESVVDWDELEREESREPKDEGTDESTSLLLARLEQENNALATNPKSAISNAPRLRSQSRPPSIQQLKKLVNIPSRGSLHYSQIPTPQMTELEFWAALVADYPQTAQRLPTLTSNKIRGGVPPPLRGVVWPSIAGARDADLHEEFQRLCGETSPYEGLIGKDIGRSFPNVEMFRDPNGEGQQMLARVLKCFSLYDSKIGYCQGLGFVVGPLLMHMSDAEAFCVLVRLMDHYDLRSCFLPDLSGLHLRIYQFQNLLSRLLPELFTHLEALGIEPVYVSQWFLSFFAATCPLPMLLRIYDVLLLEGACETLMRVALSLMQRNEKKILACTEFEDVMQLLLSRSLWDTYACNADDLVSSFVSLTSLVTRENLQSLETSYNQSQGVSVGISFPQMQAVASRILGRLWAGSNAHNSTKSLSLNPPASRPESVVRRSPSKQSMASTLNSLESSVSEASTAPTEVSASNSTLDVSKARKSTASQNKDRDLHTQIEDLLMALSDMQREHADLASDLQRVREEREEDQEVARSMLSYLKEKNDEGCEELVRKAESRFSTESRRISIMQTKHQLRDDVTQWKEKAELEAARCQELGRQIDDHEKDKSRLREEVREGRSRLQDGHRERQRLERVIQELRVRRSPSESPTDRPSSLQGEFAERRTSSGLREFKLGRSDTGKSDTARTNNSTFAKRSSSLSMQAVLATEGNQAPPEEALLLELVNAKTAEAVAKQELEEVKARMESLRKMVGGNGAALQRLDSNTMTLPVPNRAATAPKSVETPKSSASSNGGFFSGWGRRTASTSTTADASPK